MDFLRNSFKYIKGIDKIMNKRIFWSVKVPKNLDGQLEQYIKLDSSIYETKSEFIRQAVRDKLKEAEGR